jgi:hypothetical protein
VAVTYHGKPLSSRQKCYWKVKVWDKDGKVILRMKVPVNSTATFMVPNSQKITNTGGLDVKTVG